MKTRASNTERAQFKLEFKRGTARSKFPNLEIKATWRELNTIWRSLSSLMAKNYARILVNLNSNDLSIQNCYIITNFFFNNTNKS